MAAVNLISNPARSKPFVFRIQLLFFTALLFCLFFSHSKNLQAQQDKYPELLGEFFSDDARLVDASTHRHIVREMRMTLRDSQIHVVLAVIEQMSDYPELEQDIEPFTEAVAKYWEIGESRSKQGILVLFSIKDRKFFVSKTKEMSESLTDEIKEGLMGLPVQALKQGNVSLAMRRAANVLIEMVPSFDSEKGAKNIVGDTRRNNANTRSNSRRSNSNAQRAGGEPPENRNRGGGGAIVGGLICVGFAFFFIVAAVVGVGAAAARGFGRSILGGRRHRGGGGGGFLPGMLTGGLLGALFGGNNHGWGSGYHHEEHHHHHGGGGYDHGASDGGGGFDGGGFDDYIPDTFGGGDFDGGSMGEW